MLLIKIQCKKTSSDHLDDNKAPIQPTTTIHPQKFIIKGTEYNMETDNKNIQVNKHITHSIMK